MSYNGSGTFVVNSSGQPVVTGTVISSTAFNALTADLATGLSTAITKDGQTTTTARILFAQGVSSTLVTDATSATTGSIITAGGISMQKALWVGTTSRHVGAATFDAAITYGGVTLSNAVTGTGSMVLSANQTLTGTTTVAGVRAGNAGSIQQDVNTMYVGANFSSTGTYLNTSFACQNYFDQSDGTFTWRTAASGTAGNAISFSTKAILSNAGNWRWHNYGSGAITSDASGNLTAVSDPAHKTFVRSFTHGLPEIRAIANNDKFMGLHRWNEKSGMEMDGVYASFFAHNDFPVPEAVAKRQEGANTFSDRPVIMALVNAVAELTTRLESLENK